MVTAAAYLRISQDRDGTLLGVERQREDCYAQADTLGWTIAHTLIDDDLSAYSGKPRPAYEELLGLIERGEIDGVIAWHPDRLHRFPTELERFIDLVQRSGCQVSTVRAGMVDLGTASGRMTARVVGAVARHESEQKSERLKRQREQAALAGLPHGGPRAFGWQVDRLTLDPVESAAIREAADRVLAGASIRSVADDWNRRGLHPVRGGEWWASNVRALLVSPRLAALRVHHGTVVGPAAWEPILSRQDHDQLRAVLAVATPRGRRPSSLLSGLLVCGRCGNPLTHDTPKGTRRYVCPVNPGTRGCRLSISAPPVEDHVVEVVLTVAASPFAPPEPQPNAVDVGALEERMGRLAELFAEGGIGEAEWLRARTVLEAQIRDAQVVDIGKVRMAKVGSSLADRWDSMDVDERRAVLAVFVDRIVIAPGDVLGGYRRPVGRVTIDWKL